MLLCSSFHLCRSFRRERIPSSLSFVVENVKYRPLSLPDPESSYRRSSAIQFFPFCKHTLNPHDTHFHFLNLISTQCAIHSTSLLASKSNASSSSMPIPTGKLYPSCCWTRVKSWGCHMVPSYGSSAATILSRPFEMAAFRLMVLELVVETAS